MSYSGKDKEDLQSIEEKNSSEKIDVDDTITKESDKEVSTTLVPLSDNSLSMNVISAIKEIDKLYKQGVLHYSESIHRYNIEIEKLKNEIELENKKNEEEQRSLFAIESILDHECKLFEKLHDKFMQKVASLVELRDEYKDSLEESMYNEKLSRKHSELFDLVDEIEEKEMALLNQELEKINLSNIFRKKVKKLEDLTRSLKEVELEKNYFESTELQKLSYSSSEQLMLNSESEQIVDTVIMDNDK
ncbi:MAG: Unknown protein [uncultured Sulfurovum sp.]|uniref:Myosin heavy chain n=1 Tax=uncultured Sulfurovum sp. TaxID=269237 RepID=A0A6S6S0F3_9BACT|nr:MAG: Unknown protein [uncultured Sulfurovum sp.]